LTPKKTTRTADIDALSDLIDAPIDAGKPPSMNGSVAEGIDKAAVMLSEETTGTRNLNMVLMEEERESKLPASSLPMIGNSR
jgi:hypothetical protein